METTDTNTAAPAYTQLVRGLPSTAPFVGPEALERANGKRFTLRLGANESAFGPSPLAIQAMRDAVSRVGWYGDPEGHDLRAAIAAHVGVPIEFVQLGAGIDDLLGLAVRLLMGPGDAVVASLGSYPTFAFHVGGFGGRLITAPYREDRNDLEALADLAHRSQASLIYVSNPDNPSGSVVTGDEIAAFLDALPLRCGLLLDEAYGEFADTTAHAQIPYDHPQVLRFRTFSKAYGMAGARAGYIIAAPRTIRELDKIRLHFGVNLVAQAGAIAALADHTYLAQVVDEVARGRADYAALAASLGLNALPSATNFVTIDVGGVERARALVSALARNGVFIRMPGTPPLDRCIRVTVGDSDQRAAFASIFRQVWAEVDHA